MNEQPQSELPPLVDPATFSLYCWTCAENTAGTLYSLVWMMLAGKVELKRRLHARSQECLAWQGEVVQLRERVRVLEESAEPMRKQINRLLADKRHLQAINRDLVKRSNL